MRCGRTSAYQRETLAARFGDMALLDVLTAPEAEVIAVVSVH